MAVAAEVRVVLADLPKVRAALRASRALGKAVRQYVDREKARYGAPAELERALARYEQAVN